MGLRIEMDTHMGSVLVPQCDVVVCLVLLCCVVFCRFLRHGMRVRLGLEAYWGVGAPTCEVIPDEDERLGEGDARNTHTDEPKCVLLEPDRSDGLAVLLRETDRGEERESEAQAKDREREWRDVGKGGLGGNVECRETKLIEN